jgi:DNA-binding transcriptional LysR family regulator
MRNRLDSRSLVAFVAVAESLSFRQAAEVLHVSQPPLSRTIKELELRLGVSLFDRDKRGVRLTAAGELLLPRARRILRLMQDAEAQLLALPGRREIRLGLTSAVEYGKLTKTLVRGARKLGSVISTVSDSSPRLVRELRANRIDAASCQPDRAAADGRCHRHGQSFGAQQAIEPCQVE